jgi:hypothetical protein
MTDNSLIPLWSCEAFGKRHRDAATGFARTHWPESRKIRCWDEREKRFKLVNGRAWYVVRLQPASPGVRPDTFVVYRVEE